MLVELHRLTGKIVAVIFHLIDTGGHSLQFPQQFVDVFGKPRKNLFVIFDFLFVLNVGDGVRDFFHFGFVLTDVCRKFFGVQIKFVRFALEFCHIVARGLDFCVQGACLFFFGTVVEFSFDLHKFRIDFLVFEHTVKFHIYTSRKSAVKGISFIIFYNFYCVKVTL